MKSKLVIWGAAGHALVVADIIRLQGEYELIGFLDSLHPERQSEMLAGAPILGGEEQLTHLQQDGVDQLIFGFGDCRARLLLAERATTHGFSFPIAIHPSAIIAGDALIGAGTVVSAGAVINPGVEIGDHVIVNTSASVDHGCHIEDGVHLSPGVRLASDVWIGRATWVGIGATVIERKRIGAGSIIGAGAVVVSDIPDLVTAYGLPARVVNKPNNND